MQVTCKAQFFKLWKDGVLGNRTNLWDNAEEAYQSGIPEIGFREIGKSGGGAWCKVPRDQVFATVLDWKTKGRKFIMDDGCPEDKRTFQGEVCRAIRGLEGFLDTTAKLPMRQAIAAGHMKSYGYCMTKVLLDKFLDPSSRDDLDMLLELFPGHTIELTSFSVDVGVFPNRNSIFWETRLY